MPERPIVTTWIFPPIATRDYDWQAQREGSGERDLAGYGATEADAIADLRAQEAVAKLKRAAAQIKRAANTVMLSPVAMASAFILGASLAGMVS